MSSLQTSRTAVTALNQKARDGTAAKKTTLSSLKT
jgi:hypothetical protein